MDHMSAMSMSERRENIDRERWALFALTSSGKPLQEGWIYLHLLIWKYLTYHLTLVDTEDATFAPHEVWQAAWAKFQQKARAKSEAARTELLRAESRGAAKPTFEKKNLCMAPLAKFDDEGTLVWDESIAKALEALAKAPQQTQEKEDVRMRVSAGGR